MSLRVRSICASIICICLFGCHAKQGQFYSVRKGDTGHKIAHHHEISIVDIQKANPRLNIDHIGIGQRLWIPSTKKVSLGSKQVEKVIYAQKVTSQSVTKKKPKITPKTKARPTKVIKNTLNFQWPYKGGKVISSFGKRNLKMHNGIDIELPSGHVIKASQRGKVAYVGTDIQGYGKTVILQHEGHLFTIYAYLGSITVSKGQEIKQGEQVGLARKQKGQSFFHFEIRKIKTALDPLAFLK